MKALIIVFVVVFACPSSYCQLKPVDKESTVSFRIKNFGFAVTGLLSGIDGNIVFEPKNLANASFNISLDANTINTDNALRDDHLKGDSYFDVKNFPRMRFISTKVAMQGSSFVLSGELKIKDHSKKISFPFTATSSAEGYIFNGKFDINRKDFGIGGTSTISDNVEVTLSVKAMGQQNLTGK